MSAARVLLNLLRAAVLLAALPRIVAAQGDRLPSPGERIRVASSPVGGQRVVGSVVRSDADTIGIATEGGNVVAIPGSSLPQ